MNFYRAVHTNGTKRPKRLKAGHRTPVKAKHTYWDVLRQADSADEAHTCPQDVTLRTNTPQNTGMRVDGQFVTFRDKNGQLVFIGENGQMVRK
jgi:hypothetical protein